MRALLLIATVLAAGAARADYACTFADRCLAGGICGQHNPLTLEVRRDMNGWRIETAEVAMPVTLSPEAGTYFGHVFIGAKGYDNKMDAFQLTIGRDGGAFYSLHAVGTAPFGMIWRGRCEVVG